MPHPALPAALAPGTVLTKRYRIEKLIGSGGYASVYRATDMTFGYERAIKEVTDPDPGVRKQFRLEAELLINSKHPNVPHGYHLIEDGGRLYLVMDYVHGKDLEELLNESLTQRQRPLDEELVLAWAISICDALDVMHTLAVPVIHRDIKPANIKITPENHPILIDFGLAKLHQAGPTLTAAQGVSPGFAPPEQYMAKGRTDARTDIYGLGATLYACLTGKDPPEAPGRLLAQTGAGGTNGMQLVAVRRRNPQVSEPTDRLILKALELSPNNRQQSARQLRDEMRSALEHLKAARGATLVMGTVCHRCGTQNRSDATRCVHCNAPLAPADAARGEPTPASPGATGKRAALAPPGGAVGAKANGRPPTPAPVSNRPAQRPEAQPDQRTGRQAAVGMLPSGKQPVVAADDRTGKQPTPLLDRTSQKPRAVAAKTAGPALADTRGATGAAAAVARPGGAIASLPAKAPPVAATAAKAAAPSAAGGTAWIRLGSTSIGGLSKVMLALAGIEALWGALVVALSVVALTSGAHPPVVQLAIGWAIIVVFVSVLAAQALARPIYRRGTMASGRRFLQGSAIILYSVAVQAAGIWGLNVFRSQQPNPTLALASYALFGISSLIAGVVGLFTVLG